MLNETDLPLPIFYLLVFCDNKKRFGSGKHRAFESYCTDCG